MKKIISIIAVLALLLSFCACGKEKEISASSAPAPAVQEKNAEDETGASAEPTRETSGLWVPTKDIALLTTAEDGTRAYKAAELFAEFAAKYAGQNVVVKPAPKSFSYDSSAETELPGHQLMFADMDELSEGSGSSTLLKRLKSSYPLVSFTDDPFVLAVRANDERFDSAETLVEYGKTNTKKLTAGLDADSLSVLNGTKLFCETARLKYTELEKNGTLEQLYYLAKGESDFCIVNLSEIRSSDFFRVLAVLDDERIDEKKYSEVPTMAELGYDGVVLQNSVKLILLPSTADDKIKAFYSEVVRLVFLDPDFVEAYNDNTLFYKDSSETAAYILTAAEKIDTE